MISFPAAGSSEAVAGLNPRAEPANPAQAGYVLSRLRTARQFLSMSTSMSKSGHSAKAIAYLNEGFYTLYSIAKGHIVTIVNLFRPKVTLMYPEVRWELPPGYRGIPSLPIDPKTGEDKCIGCQACVRICPAQLIEVPTHMGEDKKRVVDGYLMKIGLCMFCQLCAEICPTDAILMSGRYELSAFSRDEMVYDRKKLNEIGGVWPEEPEGETEAGKDKAPATKEGP